MRPLLFLVLGLTVLPLSGAELSNHWPLDTVDPSILVRGTVTTASGVSAQSLVLDGGSLLELPGSAARNPERFTVSVWFNPYAPSAARQMLVGKNRYARGERQWGLTVEPDGKLKAHLRQDGWREISSAEPLVAGRWHLAPSSPGWWSSRPPLAWARSGASPPSSSRTSASSTSPDMASARSRCFP